MSLYQNSKIWGSNLTFSTFAKNLKFLSFGINTWYHALGSNLTFSTFAKNLKFLSFGINT
uniref:Uncharacterized protein n=1 Tax=Ciona intestinalis TaxID=7719 RepID=H2XY45_CIOIN